MLEAMHVNKAELLLLKQATHHEVQMQEERPLMMINPIHWWHRLYLIVVRVLRADDDYSGEQPCKCHKIMLHKCICDGVNILQNECVVVEAVVLDSMPQTRKLYKLSELLACLKEEISDMIVSRREVEEELTERFSLTGFTFESVCAANDCHREDIEACVQLRTSGSNTFTIVLGEYPMQLLTSCRELCEKAKRYEEEPKQVELRQQLKDQLKRAEDESKQVHELMHRMKLDEDDAEAGLTNPQATTALATPQPGPSSSTVVSGEAPTAMSLAPPPSPAPTLVAATIPTAAASGLATSQAGPSSSTVVSGEAPVAMSPAQPPVSGTEVETSAVTSPPTVLLDGPFTYRELSKNGKPKAVDKNIEHGLFKSIESNPLNSTRADVHTLTEAVPTFKRHNVKTKRNSSKAVLFERGQVHFGLTCSTVCVETRLEATALLLYLHPSPTSPYSLIDRRTRPTSR